jgi:hypothetical protein
MLAEQYIDSMKVIKAEVWSMEDCMGMTGT